MKKNILPKNLELIDHHRILDFLPLAVCLTDRQNRITYVNRDFRRLTGLTKKHALDQSISELFAADTDREWMERAEEKTERLTLRHKPKRIEISAKRINPLCTAFYLRAIADSKRMNFSAKVNDMLSKSRGMNGALRQVGLTLGCSRVFIAEFDFDFKVMTMTAEWHPGSMKQTDQKADPKIIVLPAALLKRLRKKQPFSTSDSDSLCPELGSNGRKSSAAAQKHLVLIPLLYGKELTGILCLENCMDVDPDIPDDMRFLDSLAKPFSEFTAKRRSAVMLNHFDSHVRNLTRQVFDGVVILRAYEIIEMDSRSARLLGFSQTEKLRGRSILDFCDPLSAAELRFWLDRVVRRGKQRSLEAEFQRQDGRRIYANLTAVREDFLGQTFLRLFFRDISAQTAGERILQENERRYKKLLDLLPDAVVVSDLDGKILMANYQAIAMAGFEDEADFFEDRPTTLDSIAPKHRARAISNIKKTIQNGVVKNIEYHLVKKDKSSYPVNLSAALLRNAEGNPTGFIGVVREVTARKQTERALKESELKFRSLAENISVGVFVDVDKKIVWVNKTFTEIFGYSLEELIGTGPELIVDTKTVTEVLASRDERLVDPQRVSRLRCEGRKKNGEHLIFAVTLQQFPYEGHNGTLGIVEDITEEIRAIEMLRQSEHRYRTLAEAAHELIFIIDDHNIITYLNRHAAALLGEKAENLIGRSPADILPYGHPTYKKMLEEVRKSGKAVYVEGHLDLVQQRIFLGTWLTPLTFEGERIKDILGVSRDITAQKMAERELRESEEKYKSLFETITDGIFLVHDYRFIDCNKSAERIFQFERDELIGRYPWDFSPPNQMKDADSETLAKAKIDAALSGKDQSFVWIHTKKEGEFIAEISLTRFRYRNRWLCLGIVRDITDKRKADLELERSEKRFRDIIERSLDGYFFIDQQGFVKYINNALAQMTGAKAGKSVNIDLIRSVNPQIAETVNKLFKGVLGGRVIQYKEIQIERSDGTPIWVCFNARRVIESGIVRGIEGFIKDIDEQKRAEQRLKDSEARYRALFDNIPYEVFGLDQNGYVRDANYQFLKHWGRMVNRKIERSRNPALYDILAKLLKQVSGTHQAAQSAFQLLTNQKTGHYTLILGPILTSDDGLLGYVGLIMDVTELVTALNQAKLFSARLVDIQEEERGRISREIHDSLGQYLTALELEIGAARSALQTDAIQAENRMSAASRTISSIITEVRNLCYRLRPAILDDFGLAAALRDYFNEFKQKWNISIYFRADDIGGKLSKTDETALYRITQETMTNILKHSKASRVIIRLAYLKNSIDLRIKDNGIGFDYESMQLQKRDRFGLMGMSERITILGGECRVDSQPGEGTTVHVVLPLR